MAVPKPHELDYTCT